MLADGMRAAVRKTKRGFGTSIVAAWLHVIPSVLPVGNVAHAHAARSSRQGDFAREFLLGEQRVLPAKAMVSGFKFRHETLRSALAKMIGLPKPDKPKAEASHAPTAIKDAA